MVYGALIAGGMSLLGTILCSVLNKPEEQKRTIGVGMNGINSNAPIFPMFSDETTKNNIEDANNKIKHFLDAIHAIEYDYKPEYDDGSSPNFGIKAQDIVHTDIGKDMISHDTKSGKLKVDYGPRSVEKLFAIVSNLDHRLNKAGV